MISRLSDFEQYGKAVVFGETVLRLPKTWDDTDPSSAHYLMAQAHARLGNQHQSRNHYALTLTHTKNEKLITRV